MADAPQHETVRKVLFTALEALKSYLSDIVIVGGWVPQIYAWAEKTAEIAIRSFDVDAAVAGSIPVRDGKSISDLLQGVGFKQQMVDTGFAMGAFGKKGQPMSVTEFAYKKGKLEVPIEIIAPLKGRGEVPRVSIQKELVVPALRFTDILTDHTQRITVSGENLAGKKRSFTFRVPTLPAYVFAKGLIFPRRDGVDKKGKDLAYIFEILKKAEWRKKVVAGLPKIAKKHPDKWYRTFRRNLDDAFKTQGSQGPAWVALQYPNLPANDIRKDAFETFRAFLDE